MLGSLKRYRKYWIFFSNNLHLLVYKDYKPGPRLYHKQYMTNPEPEVLGVGRTISNLPIVPKPKPHSLKQIGA